MLLGVEDASPQLFVADVAVTLILVVVFFSVEFGLAAAFSHNFMMVWRVAALLFALVAAEDGCLEYFCTELADGVCGKIKNVTHVSLNSLSCPSGTYCFAIDLAEWADTAAVNAEIKCDVNADYFEGLVAPQECGNRDTVGTLTSGEYPKLCETDDDCKLSDNSKAACKCGLNGQAYCTPPKSDEVYDDYWTACGKSGALTKKDDIEYYNTFFQGYQLFVDPADCADDLFYELEMIDDYDTKDDYATWLVMGTCALMIAV